VNPEDRLATTVVAYLGSMQNAAPTSPGRENMQTGYGDECEAEMSAPSSYWHDRG